MTIDKAKLKALAEAATPGRHYDRLESAGGGIKYECTGDDGSLVLKVDHKNNEFGFVGDRGEADEAFFLACGPATILALLAEIERLEKFEDWFVRLDQAEQSLSASFKAERDQLKAENEDYKSGQERYEQIIDDLKAENEALRKQIADLWPLKNVPPQDFRASNKCLACGDYHHGLGNLPCPRCTPVAQSAMAKEVPHG
ncbi:hypothetical protein CXG50_12190 [Pseudomonas plecoglossicida]|uniref:ead/Ea22-like family protein n=1 Tax=Pseudomonas plecoglossicida TaxID=70775 RepID=UPI000C7D84E3|nr:ead/Ea22-like family protein [Pseudomonas plecoglossicida]PLU99901.1 hypothetical protein CXG52_06655 [Pseudomonas plecoglossicida]PLV09161.1 hypothetical protein CXG50_12190 [Pseudomonas plecoglossicida]